MEGFEPSHDFSGAALRLEVEYKGKKLGLVPVHHGEDPHLVAHGILAAHGHNDSELIGTRQVGQELSHQYR